MRRTFCDRCDIDITSDSEYPLTYYANTLKFVEERVFCSRCYKEFLKVFNKFKELGVKE